MRIIFTLAAAILILASCGNDSAGSATFCDTACRKDSFLFKPANEQGTEVTISIRDCRPDTLTWTHADMGFTRQVDLNSYLKQDVRLHPSFIDCMIEDTSHAWLTFNDCITGRGYLMKLPFQKAATVRTISGALNDFDPKFHVDKDLRAYTDRGSIFVVDVHSGKEATMTFRETYDIDFNKIHEIVDTVHITRNRIFAVLLKDGKEVPFEKQISL
ncbi:MAG TPA: hypothetical protein VFZ78_08720 [Flavisolibacter sp.]